MARVRIFDVSKEWIETAFAAVDAAGGATIGLAVAFKGHKVLLGSMIPGEWHAVIELEDEDGEFSYIEVFEDSVGEALVKVVERAEEGGIEPQC